MLALVYNNIQEEKTEALSFEKNTVSYVLNNLEKAKKMIMGISKIYDRNIVEEILSDLVMYLAKYSDYDINCAFKEETGTIVTLESYVASQAKHCCQRYKMEKYKREHNIVSLDSTVKGAENSNSKDNKATLGDFVADLKKDEIDEICYSIEDNLYELRYIRATYDIDIYLMVYLRLKISDTDKYNRALEACGYSRKEIIKAEEKLIKQEEIKTLFKCMAITNITHDVTKYIEQYIYCIDAVNMMIDAVEA